MMGVGYIILIVIDWKVFSVLRSMGSGRPRRFAPIFGSFVLFVVPLS